MKNRITIQNGKGFTLVELLAAMTIFALIGLLVADIVNATARTTRICNNAANATAQVRLAFDTIGADLGTLVKRKDIDFQATNLPSGPSLNSGTSLLFLSDIGSPDNLSKTGLPGGNRESSIIYYKVDVHADNKDAQGNQRICLLRGTVPLGLNDVGFMGITSSSLPVRFPGSFLPTEFDILAPGILRVVVGFQLYPDNQSVTLENGTLITSATGQIVYSAPVHAAPAHSYIDLNRISSLIVGIVAIDTENLKHLTAADASDLANKFPVPPDSTTPLENWASMAKDVSNLGNAPLPVRQALRVYQRTFPITYCGWKEIE